MLNVKDNKTMMYTDLAVEIQEECSGRQGEIPGVVLEQYKEDDKGIRVTKIQIQTADGAKRMGRPIGNYMTLESADKEHSDEHSDKNLSGTKLPDTNLLASYINGLLPSSAHSFLIVGLGNANMTADALGPLTIEKMAQSGMASYTSMIVPGVFAQTGMESCEIIQGIVQQTSPDCIITVDALAARSAFRLGTTVQLTDTGIRPGSGVGNARKGITKENMKIPVIAIGIPTVVSAAAIVSDAMDSLKQIGYNETILGSIAMLDKEEYYQLISEVFAPELGSLFVMPKNLDEELDTMSSLLAASLSQVICKR
mgnify:FL=1